jgi:23S rRNA (pseudouridine1915-N3)-methyltransferase
VKLTFLSVGKDRSGLFAPGVEAYLERLRHVARVEVVELPASRTQGLQGRNEEGEALLARLSQRDLLVALDERGKGLSSIELATWVGRQRESARDLAFAIGGDEGLAEAVRARAGLVLSLSRLTMPHRLARLVLAEQVYRAFTILAGEPYHRT